MCNCKSFRRCKENTTVTRLKKLFFWNLAIFYGNPHDNVPDLTTSNVQLEPAKKHELLYKIVQAVFRDKWYPHNKKPVRLVSERFLIRTNKGDGNLSKNPPKNLVLLEF